MEETFIIYQVIKRKQKINYSRFILKTILYIFLINSISNNFYSEIHLIISGKGIQEVINHEFIPAPSKIFVNGEIKAQNVRTCQLEEEINNITLGFQSQIESCTNMFHSLLNLIEIDFSGFDASKVINMSAMFHGCSNLEKVNLGNINTSLVKDMNLIFFGCSKLTSIDLSKIDTSSLEDMTKLFQQCTQLTSVDFSNFDTSKVTSIAWMFEGASNLEKVVFGNINTSSLEDMAGVFCNCFKLAEVDLWRFDTSKVTDMNHMFTNCMELKYLNLSNFDTSKVGYIVNIFFNCYSLKYLNIENFQISNSTTALSIFESLPQRTIICVQNSTIKNALSSLNLFLFCSDNCFELNNSKIDINGGICLDSCLKSNNDQYEYENLCYIKCPKGTLVNNYQCLDNECESSSDSNVCLGGNPIGYYYDSIDEIYKRCYEKCYSCYEEGNETNNNCIECKDNLILLNDTFNISNCFENCSNYYYFDESNNYHCTESEKCPPKYSKLIEEKRQCIYQMETTTFFEIIESTIDVEESTNKESEAIQEKEYSSLFTELYESSITTKESFYYKDTEKIKYISDSIINSYSLDYKDTNNITEWIETIKENMKKGKYINNIDKGNDFEFQKNNIGVIISTLEYQKNNMNNKNKTIIDLGRCTNILKEEYNISSDSYIYIFQIEIESDKYKIPKIEYEIYSNLKRGNLNLTKLNLTLCKNEKIEILIPVSINDDIEKYNASSDYYNNICSTTTSKFGTDISLSDRKNEFIGNNMTLCEENCNLVDYDYQIQKAKCSCDIKLNIPYLFDDIQINKEELYKSFTDINNIANLKLLKCYKIVFMIQNFKNNYGSFIILSIIILYFICLILFCAKYFNLLKRQINKLISSLSGSNKLQVNYITDMNKEKGKNEKIKKIKRKKRINKIQKTSEDNIIEMNDNSKTKNPRKKKNDKKNNNNIKLNDQELNTLSYYEAIKTDKRTYIQYYLSLLRKNHLFIFSFFPNDDYNSPIIKLFLFFFSFSVFFTVNALFFNDDTMHKIYKEQGKFNFIYQLPKILYSSAISGVINTVIKMLALSEKEVLKLKKEKNNNVIKVKGEKLINSLRLKFNLFFLLSFILLISFCYYITCFCGVYINTKIHLIKDTVISFSLSLFYPFLIYLVPGIFRIPSLKSKKQEYKYKISLFLQII